MVTDIFLVVLGCLATVLSVFACALMFGYFRRQTQRCWQREQELSQFGYLTERVAELRKQHDDLSRDLFCAEQTIEKADLLREELQRLQTELQRLDDLRAELTHLNDELGKLRDDLDQKTQRKMDLEQAMQLANAKREELEADQQKLAETNVRLQREQDVKQTRVEHLAEQIEALERQRSDLEGRRNELAHQRDQLESQLQTLNQQRLQQFEEYNRAIGELSGRRDALSKEVDQLKEDVHKLQSDRQHVETQVASGRAEHEQLQQSMAHFQAEHQELQGERQRLQNEKSTLEQQKLALQRQVDNLGEQRESLERDLAENRRIKQEVDQLYGKKQRIEQEVDSLHVVEQRLSEVVDDLRKERERLITQTGQATGDQRTADLWAPVFQPQDYEMIKAPVEELEQLSALQSHLRRCGLRFHRRVLYAFHTALKVNDISPLVVLAGISGTGKSELPRRYAEAMGMHFLNLAVQPRWDSPQDMFGFFNYLDGRYRATELGRALIQMDPYFDRDDRGWTPPKNWAQNSLREQMLLVLLDEMNLARIEYYFSDFLSRLEMRRGIDLDQAEYRRKAEIPLEIGRTGTTDSVMRVFVARNVFFVGTMNEDETTQSLSDKVVDRANVLRFGPPRRLTIEPGLGHQEQSDMQLGTRRLPYDHWSFRFAKDPGRDDTLDTETRNQIQVWLHELNTAMRKIRRPFAYRVSRAMEGYIANYPHVDGQPRLDWALADQIEQKMLPKFRGLDPSEPAVRDALDTLRNLIPNDTALHNAIEDSIDADQHQFVWQGVNRDEDDDGLEGFRAEVRQLP